MIAAKTNGRVRKSLADQLDRFDHMLDGLAEGLNEAVAGAVKEAVQAVVIELLTNANLQAQLKGLLLVAEPPAPVPVPGLTLGQRLARLGQFFVACLAALGQGCLQRWQRARHAVLAQATDCQQTTSHWLGQVQVARQRAVAQLGNHLRWYSQPVVLLWRLRVVLAWALGLGLTMGTATWFASPWLAALLSGVSGFLTGVLLQLPVLLSRLLRRVLIWGVP